MSGHDKITTLESHLKSIKNRREIPEWKKKNAAWLGETAMKLNRQISNNKNLQKILDEFKNIVVKVIKSNSEEQMLDHVFSSIFVIETLIPNITLKMKFREEIVKDFLRKNGVTMIVPSKGDIFKPEFHLAIDGKGTSYQIKRIEMPGFKYETGKVIKKALVILE